MSANRWWVVIAAAGVIAGLAVILILRSQSPRIRPVSAEEEQRVAETLLVEKLSGPRYFKAPLSGIADESGSWIEVSEAIRQLPDVAAARGLSPEAAREVAALIERLSESPPSRAVGGPRIRVNRLNLSLDSRP